MTRKEEVEIISERYGANSLMYGKLHNDTLKGLLKHYQEGFISGVKWADENPKSPWIDTDEDLPYKHDNLLIKCLHYSSKETKPVLTLSDEGSYQVCVMFVNEEGKWEWSCSVAPCYWMPIILPKEYEIKL